MIYISLTTVPIRMSFWNEFKQNLKINENINIKDWDRMSDLIQSNKDGESVANAIKDKNIKQINK